MKWVYLFSVPPATSVVVVAACHALPMPMDPFLMGMIVGMAMVKAVDWSWAKWGA